MYTEQEKIVFQLLMQGKNNREIAEKLVISRHTAKAHVEHILCKSNTHSRIELIIKTLNAEIDQLKRTIEELQEKKK